MLRVSECYNHTVFPAFQCAKKTFRSCISHNVSSLQQKTAERGFLTLLNVDITPDNLTNTVTLQLIIVIIVQWMTADNLCNTILPELKKTCHKVFPEFLCVKASFEAANLRNYASLLKKQ